MAVGLIQGKATRIVWPPKRWQRLEKVTCDERLELEGKFSISEEEKTGEHSIKPQVDKENGINTACRSYSVVDDSGSASCRILMRLEQLTRNENLGEIDFSPYFNS